MAFSGSARRVERCEYSEVDEDAQSAQGARNQQLEHRLEGARARATETRVPQDLSPPERS